VEGKLIYGVSVSFTFHVPVFSVLTLDQRWAN